MSAVCRVCIHPDRARIDEAIVAREPHRSIASRFNLKPSSVSRHKRNHLARALIRAREAQEAAHGESLLGQVKDLASRAIGILNEAEGSGDGRTALLAIREARGCLELLGKATGELVERHAHVHAVGRVDPQVVIELRDHLAALRKMQEDQPRRPWILDSPHVYSGEAALPRAYHGR
jgi:hypothetical protein